MTARSVPGFEGSPTESQAGPPAPSGPSDGAGDRRRPPATDLVARSTITLEAQQSRVALLLAAAVGDDRWQAALRPEDRQRLVRLGHFSDYATELDWTVGDVAGHLRDSAWIFSDRLMGLTGPAVVWQVRRR